MPIPSIYRFVIRWIMPGMLAAILIAWSLEHLPGEPSFAELDPADRIYIWAARFFLVALFSAVCLLVHRAFRCTRSGET